MYRNNFRSPQMQPRNNVGMRNGSCGGKRNTGSEDCRRAVPVEPACTGAEMRSDDCGRECSCQRPSAPDCGCATVPECGCATVPECGCAAMPDCVVVIESDCGCDKPAEADNGCRPSKKDSISEMPLAMAYVPWQDFKDIYPEDESWCRGTIFAQLDLEFACRRCN